MELFNYYVKNACFTIMYGFPCFEIDNCLSLECLSVNFFVFLSTCRQYHNLVMTKRIIDNRKEDEMLKQL